MTCYCYSITIINITFQLTSSRRGWLNQTAALLCYFYFNSHPHEEDDDATTKAKLTDTVFQLTSSRRGWHTLLNGSSFANGISTHILTKRMTVLFPYWVCCHNISTHILTKRMTPSVPILIAQTIFQLTSSRRGWQILTYVFVFVNIFQLTSSRRGWP